MLNREKYIDDILVQGNCCYIRKALMCKECPQTECANDCNKCFDECVKWLQSDYRPAVESPFDWSKVDCPAQPPKTDWDKVEPGQKVVVTIPSLSEGNEQKIDAVFIAHVGDMCYMAWGDSKALPAWPYNEEYCEVVND